MPLNIGRRAHLRRMVAGSARWLHIYLSMFSFGLVLFFSVTGLTLNHPEWAEGHEVTENHRGEAPGTMLHTAGPDGADKLGLVEMLRSRDKVQGAVSDFRVDDSQISISFKAPGYTADAFIDRDTGKYDLTIVRNGFIAVINDLHKGRDSGKGWAAVIDFSAILLAAVSLTGLALMWFLYRKRISGFVLAALAFAAMALFIRFFVP